MWPLLGAAQAGHPTGVSLPDRANPDNRGASSA